MLDWSDYQIILAIHRTGTLSDAARLLKVSQSTMSRALQRIERRIKQPVFLSLSGRYRISPEGARFLDVAEKFDRAVSELGSEQNSSSFVPGSVVGTVRLTSIEGLLSGYLVSRLPEFRKRHPAVALEINGSNETLDLLKRGYEVALRLERERTAGSLLQRKVVDFGVGVYARTDAASDAQKIHARDWIGYESALSEIPEEKWLSRKLKRQKPRLRVSGYLSMEKAIEAGLGSGLLPFYIGDQNPRLRRISGAKAILTRSIWLICHPETRREPAVDCFTQWLIGTVSNDQGMLMGILSR